MILLKALEAKMPEGVITHRLNSFGQILKITYSVDMSTEYPTCLESTALVADEPFGLKNLFTWGGFINQEPTLIKLYTYIYIYMFHKISIVSRIEARVAHPLGHSPGRAAVPYGDRRSHRRMVRSEGSRG